MGGFTPFKRHANKFNYTPRYYDPAKEAREQRRAELRGKRSDDVDGAEYQPGQYIRTSSAARAARRRGGDIKGGGGRRMLIMIAAIGLMLYFGSILFSSLVDMLDPTERAASAEVEEFNPYTPITIVPNDYDPTLDK